MKALLMSMILVSSVAWAQTVDVKDVSADTDGETTTTIEIKKAKAGMMKSDNTWEITDGTADLEGDAGATNKDAKAKWKKACDDWKKEFRQDNNENKILSLNCGTATCGGDVGNKTCTSKASYKIKTRVN